MTTRKENIKKIKINGIKTIVILPKSIKKEDFPKRINTENQEIGGLVCTL